MASKAKRTEASLLERYRVTLENAPKTLEISSALAEFGYDETKMSEGQNLFNQTRNNYDSNKQEKEEQLAAYQNFAASENLLNKIYLLHRKKAKIIFTNDSVTYTKLQLDNSIPDAYIDWLEMVKVFYSTILADETLQQKVARLKVPANELTAGSDMITDLEKARADYLKERGESQVAKEEKDDSFDELNKWMSEFYSVAKIAFEDTPQLLEVLGVYVKS